MAEIVTVRTQAQREWIVRLANAQIELSTFASGLAMAFGDISWDEAVDSLKREAAAIIERNLR